MEEYARLQVVDHAQDYALRRGAKPDQIILILQDHICPIYVQIVSRSIDMAAKTWGWHQKSPRRAAFIEP